MKKLFFLLVAFVLSANITLNAQYRDADKVYHKVKEAGYWEVLNKIGNEVRENGTKKYEFGGWLIYFPKRYINFVKKFPKGSGTYEYYIKLCNKGVYDPHIRTKEGPGKSSVKYEDPDGSETKLLLKEVNEVISKITTTFRQKLTSK